MKLSIITINFDNKDGLIKTIESVKEQYFTDFEYIIIDGGSTDGSNEIIEKNSNIIDYYVSEKDKGIFDAMNKGIIQAHGEFCLFLNSGDYLTSSDCLEKLFSKIQDKSTNTIFYTDVQFIKSNEIISKLKYKKKVNLFFFLMGYTLNHQNSIIPTNLFTEVEFYRTDCRFQSDWYFYMLCIWKKLNNHKKNRKCNYFLTMIQTGCTSDSKNQELIDIERNSLLKELFKNNAKIIYLLYKNP